MLARSVSLPALALLTAATLSLSACADDGPGTRITVEAGPGTCSVSRDTADGPVLFVVTNVGDGLVTVSLYDSEGELVDEVDDIGPAMTQIMAANVYDGEYELRCEPVPGESARATITVG